MSIFLYRPKNSSDTLHFELSPCSSAPNESKLKEQDYLIIKPFAEKPSWFKLAPTVKTFEKAKHEIPNRVAQNISVTKSKYVEQLMPLIATLKSGQKAVIAQKETINFSSSLNLFDLFNQAKNNYQNTFSYLLKLPNNEFWIGSSPELLGNWEKDKFFTVSLAGTRPCSIPSSKSWGQKEMEEQQIVSSYISTLLQKEGFQNIEKSSPKTITTGKLQHIQTTFSANKKSSISEKLNFLFKLHPTPAVGGFPVSNIHKWISSQENFERELYSGFIAMVSKEKIEAFVNLRCMKISGNKAELFAGGGITKESNPINEWEEIQQKLKTMKNLLFSNE